MLVKIRSVRCAMLPLAAGFVPLLERQSPFDIALALRLFAFAPASSILNIILKSI